MTVKKIRTALISIAVATVLCTAMKNFNPSKKQHLITITELMEQALDNVFEKYLDHPEENQHTADYFALEVTSSAVERITEQNFRFFDYNIVSIGKMEDSKGKTHTVSFGILGEVLTIGDEEAEHLLQDIVDNKEYKTKKYM